MKKIATTFVGFLFVFSSLMETVESVPKDYLDACLTGCAQRESKYQDSNFSSSAVHQCESNCHINCSPLDKGRFTKSSKKHHFVLAHGLGQGAWNWYKVTTMLRCLGHQVTALDLAASGVNPQNLGEVNTMLEYSKPLLDFMATIPSEQRVILVGHSLGGITIAYAMERFPQKISAGVFLTALMPDISHPPSYVFDKYMELALRAHLFTDTQFSFDGNKTTILFGSMDLFSKFSQQSPSKDKTLILSLQRVGSIFLEDLSTAPLFSEKGYGSVTRVYIISNQDKTISPDFQRWMIKNYPVEQVKKIEDSDHFVMISRPMKVSSALLDIAEKYT